MDTRKNNQYNPALNQDADTLWNFCPWRFPRPNWKKPWETWSEFSWSRFQEEVTRTSLPVCTNLWFMCSLPFQRSLVVAGWRVNERQKYSITPGKRKSDSRTLDMFSSSKMIWLCRNYVWTLTCAQGQGYTDGILRLLLLLSQFVWLKKHKWEVLIHAPPLSCHWPLAACTANQQARALSNSVSAGTGCVRVTPLRCKSCSHSHVPEAEAAPLGTWELPGNSSWAAHSLGGNQYLNHIGIVVFLYQFLFYNNPLDKVV